MKAGIVMACGTGGTAVNLTTGGLPAVPAGIGTASAVTAYDCDTDPGVTLTPASALGTTNCTSILVTQTTITPTPAGGC